MQRLCLLLIFLLTANVAAAASKCRCSAAAKVLLPVLSAPSSEMINACPV